MNVTTWGIANYERAGERQVKPTTMAENSECFSVYGC